MLPWFRHEYEISVILRRWGKTIFAKLLSAYIHLHDGKPCFLFTFLAPKHVLQLHRFTWPHKQFGTKASVFCQVNDQTNRNSHSTWQKKRVMFISALVLEGPCMHRRRSSFTYKVCTHYRREPMLMFSLILTNLTTPLQHSVLAKSVGKGTKPLHKLKT